MSFVVACYNLPDSLLRECIESLRALSLRPAEREIILVDDGSDTPPIAQLKDLEADIIYVRQANGGLSSARNLGLRMASGRYVQFVDGDDRLLTAPYEHCLDLARYSQPDMVLFDFARQDEAPSAHYDDAPAMSGTDLMRRQNLRGSACGYLFRKAILGQLRFTPGIYHEDEEFTPQLLLRADVVISTTARAYLYRKRESSIMTTGSVRHRLQRLNDNLLVLKHLSTLSDTLPNDGRIALGRRVNQLTMDYLYNVILLTGSRHYLDRRIADLRRLGLYPLPDRNYTRKYKWFRRLANSKTGLSMLMRAIPMMKKER